MAQATYVVSANQSGSDAMTALVAALEAADTTHKGSSAPSYKAAGTPWLDDSASPSLVLKMYDGTDWITMGTFNATTNLFTPSNAQLPDGSTNYAADSVGTDSYAITLSPAPTAYTTGMVIQFKAGTANTGAATLNVNSLGAKTIKKNYNTDLATGDIVANQLVQVCYDGTNFQLMSPSAAVAAGAGLVWLATKTASASASLDFTSYISSTYDEYEIHFFDIIPATDTADFHLLTSTNNGSSWDTGAGNYEWAFGNDNSGGTAGNAGSTADTKIKLKASLGNNTGESASGWIKIYNPLGTSAYHHISWEIVGRDSAASFGRASGGGSRIATADIDAVRLIMSTGNITSGHAHIYGVAKA